MLLATGKLRGPVTCPVAQTHTFENFHGPPPVMAIAIE
ncbi:unnamed protein product, partial [marine sediment metagenome]